MLETKRLLHREFNVNDLDRLIEIHFDMDVAKFIGGEKTTTKAWNKTRLDFYISCYEKYGFGTQALIWKENNAIIGWSGLQFVEEMDEVELDYGMIKDFWRKGIGFETASAWLKYGFEKLALNKIIALAVPENIGSWRIMEKLGMTYQKTDEFFGMECKYYAIFKEEFLTQNN